MSKPDELPQRTERVIYKLDKDMFDSVSISHVNAGSDFEHFEIGIEYEGVNLSPDEFRAFVESVSKYLSRDNR